MVPNAREEWQKLQNQIKENNDEIEKLKFNLKLTPFINDADEASMKIDRLNALLQRAQTNVDNSQGDKKLKYLNDELSLTKQLSKENSTLLEGIKKQRKEYRKKIDDYGFKFDKNGQITNYDTAMDKLSKTEDYDKVKDWVDDYISLGESMQDAITESQDLKNSQKELEIQIKNQKLESAIEPFNNSLDKSNSKIKSIQNNLDILNIKFDNAYGADKLNILKQQIELNKQLKAEQDKQLNALSQKENALQNELSKNGFKFDGLGNITNIDTALKKLENTNAYEYVKSVLEQWKEVHEDEIPDAIKSVEEYDKAIKDSYNNQLNITKEIEDKITDMKKKEIEDRKKAIEKETETVKSELEKQKKAYNDARSEADYQNDYNEKTDEVAKLEKDLANARKDTSLGNKKKIAELEKQLADAKKDLDKFVQDRTDDLINKGFDDAITSVEDKNNQKIEDLENEWTDSKIAEAVAQALNTGIFTDLDGNISNLQDAMLEFAETSGEAFGVMGEVVKENLVANLGVALDTLKNYSTVLDGLGLNSINTNLPTGNISSNQVTTGDISINITTQSNANEQDIAKEVKKAVDDALKGAVQGL